jgi:hypothetical protein
MMAEWCKAGDPLPPDGTWCWVIVPQQDQFIACFPACRNQRLAGGWTNGDTWEDFYNQVTHWQVISEPELPK